MVKSSIFSCFIIVLLVVGKKKSLDQIDPIYRSNHGLLTRMLKL